MQHLFDVVTAGGDPDSVIEDAFGVLHSRAGTNPDGPLRVRMLAGRQYVIVCTFADTPKSPPHMALGMIGSIQVKDARAGGY